jgi:hypothetical protein
MPALRQGITECHTSCRDTRVLSGLAHIKNIGISGALQVFTEVKKERNVREARPGYILVAAALCVFTVGEFGGAEGP